VILPAVRKLFGWQLKLMAHAQRWVRGVTASHFFTLRRAGKVPAKQGFRLKPEEALDISADLLCTMLRKEKSQKQSPGGGNIVLV
jgi:hypothetical protein